MTPDAAGTYLVEFPDPELGWTDWHDPTGPPYEYPTETTARYAAQRCIDQLGLTTQILLAGPVIGTRQIDYLYRSRSSRMKITIEHGHTKRTIDGAFNLCCSRETLALIADTLTETCREWREQNISQGWVKIIPLPTQTSLVNQSPIPWDDP